MVGGTTANDLATCELKVMKRRNKNKSNTNPNPKSNPFLIKGERDGVWVARWTLFPVLGSSVCIAGIDTAAVVIDGMTARVVDNVWWSASSSTRRYFCS
jgi:hypothetical protein